MMRKIVDFLKFNVFTDTVYTISSLISLAITIITVSIFIDSEFMFVAIGGMVATFMIGCYIGNIVMAGTRAFWNDNLEIKWHRYGTHPTDGEEFLIETLRHNDVRQFMVVHIVGTNCVDKYGTLIDDNSVLRWAKIS